MLFERAVRPWLFRRDAEYAHEWTLARLGRMSRATKAVLKSRYAVSDPVTVFGVRFPNRVGLAAGMDKNGLALRAWPAMGFGFVEVGTVTWHAQPGNEKPRVFRQPEREAIVNRMGFNNFGAAALARRLSLYKREIPLGISLGKSKVTPLDGAVEDYRRSFEVLREYGDYFAVNVSSPNTPGLRELQEKSHLDGILAELKGGPPVLVKIAPDLSDSAIAGLLEVCTARGVAGIIATNTTIVHDGPTGGLSGAPLGPRAREVVSFVHKESGLPIIGVGGIMSTADAHRMLDAGASLIQLYTGFVYHGPALVRGCARGHR
ncbi:MAG TPA: quinone-dependent dihydroorotate dehydrogenase [Candidatus Limnocylindrales bacterium]|nr:quinone-dependent dihydroorotate dehydrogenase [Candidatus Limnocylindrales bacterium]